MKRPSFQFYPSDWTGNSNLRRCSHAEKGIWLDVMCLMHDQAEYGVLRWPLKEIAQAVGCKPADLKSLSAKGVIKGADAGQRCEAFIYTPRSGRKDGEPVTLVPAQDGPIWFSSRMVKDEYVRATAGASTRFGANEEDEDRPERPRTSKEGTERAKLRERVLAKTGGLCHHCETPLSDLWEIDHLVPRSKGGRHTFANLVPSCVRCNQDKSDTMPDDWARLGAARTNTPSHSPSRRQGDGSSSSPSSSPSGKDSEGKPSDGTPSAAPPTGELPGVSAKAEDDPVKSEIWRAGRKLLVDADVPKTQAGKFIGELVSRYGQPIVLDAVRAAVKATPADPREYLMATCQRLTGERAKQSGGTDWTGSAE